jgi:asparagine synthase (glutamine-hydrolysing)
MIARHLGIPVGDDSRRTYYRHVHRVLPAHVLKLSARGLIEEPYWEIDLTRELRLSSVGEYAEALRESFTEAVRSRMRAVTPVACMLSGGLDSVAIACTAARRTAISGDPPIHTLSAVYPSVPESDERSDIEEVLAGIAAIPHFFAADATDPIAEIDRMNGLAGGAIRGRNLYLNWELARVAGSEGARVVLDGFDGDSVVSHGIGYLNELAIAGRWCKLARVSVAFSRRRGTPPLADLRSVVRFGRRTRRQLALDSAAQKPSLPSHLPANAHFASGFSGRLRAREWNATEREIHGRHLQSAVLREALGWVEACGAGRQVEVRFPFFDVRVAELCVSMPAGQKLRRGWTRFAMRKAMEGIVPSSVQWRSRKANMHAGWNHAYRKHQTGRVRALLSDPNSAVRAFLDPDRVRELHDRFIAGEASQAEEAVLWTAISLALWLSPQAGEAAQAPGSFSSIRPRSMRSEQ